MTPETKLTRDDLTEVNEAWGISLQRLRPDIAVAGSPQRCSARAVAEDQEGSLFIVEKIAPAAFLHKRRIAGTLDRLHRRGLHAARPYLPDRSGEWLARLGRGIWQIAPFVQGVALARPDYVHDGWRGAALADFLVDLRSLSLDLSGTGSGRPFSLFDFIHDLEGKLRRHDPDILDRVRPVLSYLDKDYFPEYRELPRGFAHGDYHPLNVIWGPRSLDAVIDWEFLGDKAAAADAFNLVGCIGMELPEGLTGELVRNFLARLLDTGWLSDPERRCFVDGVLAQRFAWLSEWLHTSDEDMVDLECIYIRLLFENRRILKRAWERL